ncbi:hypothetical protein F2Q70_00003948 [Brassica cretica]|uniref:Uncharacterized protein n=1 Tax=Brassica cretica TaxID=69181 RepID=A0A8S9ISE8_BRACR|nr:hypothetical protein F2Q70_00003948 [Brassica cretica]
MDQYTEPIQDGAQDNQIIPTEVRVTDQAVFRIDPRKSGKELRLEPRPHDRTDRTEAHLPRTTHQAKTDAECPDERTDGSVGQYDQFLNFDDQNFSKARILQLSKDLGRAGTKLAHEPYPADCSDHAATVLLLTAKEPLGSDEPGR